MTKPTRDRIILITGLLIIGLYLSRNLIKDIFSPARSVKTKSGKDYAKDIIGQWSLDKWRTLLYKEKRQLQHGGNVVGIEEVGKYILTGINTSDLEFKQRGEYTHKLTGNLLFDTRIEGEWSIDDNKLVLEETKNEEHHLAGLLEGRTRPAQLRFEWHYLIVQLDSSSLVLLVHHRKPDYVSGHAMEINNGDTLFYKVQR